MYLFRLLIVCVISTFFCTASVYAQSPVKLKVSSATGKVGETVCVDVTVDDFVDISSFGFILYFDSKVVNFLDDSNCGIEKNSDLKTIAYSVSCPAPTIQTVGTIIPSSDVKGVTLENGTRLLRICLKLVGQPGDIMPIRLTSDDTNIPEFRDKNEEVVPFEYSEGTITILPEENKIIPKISFCNKTNKSEASITFSAVGGKAPYKVTCPNLPDVTLNKSGEEYTHNNVEQGSYTFTFKDSSTPPVIQSQTVTIRSSAPVVIDLDTKDARCFNKTSGSVELKSLSIDNHKSLYWASKKNALSVINNRDVMSVSDIGAGDYYLEVTDQNGCKHVKDFSINQPDKIVAKDIKVDISCHDSKPIFSGSAKGGKSSSGKYKFVLYKNKGTFGNVQPQNNESFEWDMKDNNAWNQDTAYVKISDDNKCIETYLLKGIRPDTLKASVKTTDQCTGTFAELSITGGTPQYKTAWFRGVVNLAEFDNKTRITELKKGNYRVAVKDANGCEAEDLFEITTSGGDATIKDEQLKATAAKCHNSNDGSITLEIDKSKWTVTWYSDPERKNEIKSRKNQFEATDLVSGTYYFSFYNAQEDCTVDDKSKLVPAPQQLTITTNASHITCTGDGKDGKIDVMGEGGTTASNAYTYQLRSNNAAIEKTFRSGPISSSLSDGTYKIIIIDDNKCKDSTEVTIKPAESITIEIDRNNTTNIGCNSTNARLVVIVKGGYANTYKYQWHKDNAPYTTSAKDTLDIVEKGSYTLSVVDGNGCKSEKLAPPFVVDDYEEITFNIAHNPILCHGNTTCLGIKNIKGGTGQGYKFQINSGAVITNIDSCQYVRAGRYSLVVIDSDDCKSTSADTIIPEPKKMDIVIQEVYDTQRRVVDTITVNLGEESNTLNVTANRDIQDVVWKKGNIEDKTGTSVKLYVLNDTTFTVHVKDKNECVETKNLHVIVNKSKIIHVPNAISPNGDGENDVLEIYLPKVVKSIKLFEVYDRWGGVVFSEENIDRPIDNTITSYKYLGWGGNNRKAKTLKAGDGTIANPGVYVWKAVFDFIDGTSEVRSGTINVMTTRPSK